MRIFNKKTSKRLSNRSIKIKPNRNTSLVLLVLAISALLFLLYQAAHPLLFVYLDSLLALYLIVPVVVLQSVLTCCVLNLLFSARGYAKIQLLPPAYNGIDSAKWSGRLRIRKMLIGIALSIAYVYAVGFVASLVHSYTDKAGEQIDMFSYIFSAPVLYKYYMLAPGIAEEVMMRAGVLHVFLVLKRPKLGIVVSSSIFGALHIIQLLIPNNVMQLGDLLWISNIAIVGVFLAYLYIRFGLIIVMFLHWLWNASWDSLMQEIEQSLITPILAVAFMAVCELVISYRRRLSVL